ncbi:hypothetical protein CERSUDRAFT_97787 [Gelatoporia subvermispora B]|uniref:Uncharacterized protein n=1 Tax=Ceriporiopsis subvermispora (strain B) TaxID=914234 RepID=M2R778_CERS8|nr:hypothetical protein CERSUDRAFT_97787 [Gelatoporia subvermispora B]
MSPSAPNVPVKLRMSLNVGVPDTELVDPPPPTAASCDPTSAPRARTFFVPGPGQNPILLHEAGAFYVVLAGDYPGVYSDRTTAILALGQDRPAACASLTATKLGNTNLRSFTNPPPNPVMHLSPPSTSLQAICLASTRIRRQHSLQWAEALTALCGMLQAIQTHCKHTTLCKLLVRFDT